MHDIKHGGKPLELVHIVSVELFELENPVLTCEFKQHVTGLITEEMEFS